MSFVKPLAASSRSRRRGIVRGSVGVDIDGVVAKHVPRRSFPVSSWMASIHDTAQRVGWVGYDDRDRFVRNMTRGNFLESVLNCYYCMSHTDS